MAILETDLGKISYEVAGEGEPLVMLRGLGRSMRHWLGYERELARHFKVVALDLRGIGESTRPSRFSTTVYDMADDVATVLEHLGISGAHVLGVSLGGMVTLAFGLRYAERCRSLIVINTSIGGQLTLRITPSAVKGIARAGLLKGEKRHIGLIENLVGNLASAERKKEIANRYGEIERKEGMYAATVAKQLASALRFRPARQLKEMKVPTLIAYGTHDIFVPNINSIKLARILPAAKLVPIPNAGHEPSLDQSEKLTEAIRAFVAGLGGS